LFLHGMDQMSESLKAVAGGRMKSILEELTKNRLMGAITGAFVTAVIQSSSATTGIVIVMASQGLMTLTAGIALIFGANIGTCITAVLASIGKPREALRASVVHVLFNVLGVVVWLPFIDRLAELVTWLSLSSSGLEGMARLASETPRQMANAHTIFNIANTLIFLPFAGIFARVVQRLVPDRPAEEERLIRAKYLDEESLSTPSLALGRARLKILHLGDLDMEMMRQILPAMLHGERASSYGGGNGRRR